MSKPFTPETFLHAVDVVLLKRFFNYLLPESLGDNSVQSWPEETWDDTPVTRRKGARAGKIIAKLKALDKGLQCRCYQEMHDIYYVSRGKFRNMNIVQFVQKSFPSLLHDENLDDLDTSCENMALVAFLHFNEGNDPILLRYWKSFKWDALNAKSLLKHTGRFTIADNGAAGIPTDDDVERAAGTISGELSRYLVDKNMCGEFVQVESIPSTDNADVLRLLINFSGTEGTRLTWDDEGIRPGRDNNVGTIQITYTRSNRAMIIRSDIQFHSKLVHNECSKIVARALFGKEAEHEVPVKIDFSGFSTLQGAREILKRPISNGVISRISAIAVYDPVDGGETIEFSCGSGCAYERLMRRLKDADSRFDGGMTVKMVTLEVTFNAMPDKPRTIRLTPFSCTKTANEELNALIDKTIEELDLVEHKHATPSEVPSLFDLFTLPNSPGPI